MLSLATLKELRSTLAAQPVLSVYIAAEEHNPAERSSWRLRLQQQLDSLAAASGDDLGLTCARALVEAELAKHTGFLPGVGWVAFATADRLWYCAEVPAPMPDVARWQRGIVIGPYLRVLKQARPVVLALVDNMRARLFRYQAGGAIEPIDYRADTFIDDINERNMSKRATTVTGVRGETSTDVAARTLQLETTRLLKQVADIVLEHAGRDGLVVIGGPALASSALHDLLEPVLSSRVTIDESAYVTMSEAEALATIERGASALSQQLQLEAVATALEASGVHGRATTHVRDTAEAAALAQVDALMLTAHFIRDHEAEAETLIDQVLAFGGRVDVVDGEAAARLESVASGVAARLRYVTPTLEGRT